jgi:hypothetical protein
VAGTKQGRRWLSFQGERSQFVLRILTHWSTLRPAQGERFPPNVLSKAEGPAQGERRLESLDVQYRLIMVSPSIHRSPELFEATEKETGSELLGLYIALS